MKACLSSATSGESKDCAANSSAAAAADAVVSLCLFARIDSERQKRTERNLHVATGGRKRRQIALVSSSFLWMVRSFSPSLSCPAY